MTEFIKKVINESIKEFLFISFAIGLMLVIALIYATMYMIIAKEWQALTTF